MSNTEYWNDVTAKSAPQKLSFVPGNSRLNHLDALARVYQDYQVRNLVVRYKATTASTTTGNLVGGVSYDTTYAPADTAGILRLSPRISTAAWRDAMIHVPASRVQEKKWMKTRSEGINFFWSSTVPGNTVPGGFWVTYTVLLANPRVGS